MLTNPEVVAVGETGLDYNRMFSPKAQQLEAFSAQVSVIETMLYTILNNLFYFTVGCFVNS